MQHAPWSNKDTVELFLNNWKNLKVPLVLGEVITNYNTNNITSGITQLVSLAARERRAVVFMAAGPTNQPTNSPAAAHLRHFD